MNIDFRDAVSGPGRDVAAGILGCMSRNVRIAVVAAAMGCAGAIEWLTAPI